MVKKVTQFDIKDELKDYMREINLKNVPMESKEAIMAWIEAVELNQATFFYYDQNKIKKVVDTNFLSLDNLLEPYPQFKKFRMWFNNQVAKWEKN